MPATRVLVCLLACASLSASNVRASEAAPPSCPAPQETLDFEAPGTVAYKLTDYGAALARNKQGIVAGAQAAGASAEQQALLVAMAMQETTLCDAAQRDRSKDGGPSANVSPWNMNVDMLSMLGYPGQDHGAALNDMNDLAPAAAWLLKAFHDWGLPRTLNFHRGGRTAFVDGHSYGAADYRNAIYSIYKAIVADPRLMTDSRRVEINLHGV